MLDFTEQIDDYTSIPMNSDLSRPTVFIDLFSVHKGTLAHTDCPRYRAKTLTALRHNYCVPGRFRVPRPQ